MNDENNLFILVIFYLFFCLKIYILNIEIFNIYYYKCFLKMARIQYSGIKYPFEAQDIEKYFVDLNKTMRDNVRSQLMHVIFTPKGQKIRDPEFGTRLIHQIFEPNDSTTWGNIISEVSEAVTKYVKNVSVNDINVLKSEDNFNEVYVRIDYSVKDGNITTEDTVITRI